MLVLFTLLTIGSGVKFFGENKGNENNQKSSKRKESKDQLPIARNPISREHFATSDGKLHSYEEAYPDDEYKYAYTIIGKGSKKGHDYQEVVKIKGKESGKRKGYDYIDWLNKCSLKGEGKRKQVEIPGCGEWTIVSGVFSGL